MRHMFSRNSVSQHLKGSVLLGLIRLVTVGCATAAESDKDNGGDVGKETRPVEISGRPTTQPPTSTPEPVHKSLGELEAELEASSKFQGQWMNVTGGKIQSIHPDLDFLLSIIRPF